MIDPDADVADIFAATWNSVNDGDAVAADFWPCCRVLAQAGLLVAQETNLSAVSIGPFHLALPQENHALVDFVEVLFPSVIAGVAYGHPLPGAVSGVLSGACATFVKLGRQGTVFGRAEPDRVRWAVLMTVSEANGRQARPTSQQVIDALAEDGSAVWPSASVQQALDWLTGAETGAIGRRPHAPLIVREADGGLVARI